MRSQRRWTLANIESAVAVQAKELAWGLGVRTYWSVFSTRRQLAIIIQADQRYRNCSSRTVDGWLAQAISPGMKGLTASGCRGKTRMA